MASNMGVNVPSPSGHVLPSSTEQMKEMRVIQLRVQVAVAFLAAGAAAQAPLAWRRIPQPHPGASAMVFDSWRHRFVLQCDRTMEWDGADWRERRPVRQPGAFSYMPMVFDSARGRTVLFGGTYAVDGTTISGLWEYDGLDWTQRSLAGGPPARFNHAMAYDSLRQRVVVYGGWNSTGPLSDTWTWDGVTWLSVPATGPAPSGAMAFHSATGRIVLFGPPTTSPPPPGALGATWTFDGTSWRLEQPVTLPGWLAGRSMCEDSANGVVRMIGANDSSAWEWNGSDWSIDTS